MLTLSESDGPLSVPSFGVTVQLYVDPSCVSAAFSVSVKLVVPAVVCIVVPSSSHM